VVVPLTADGFRATVSALRSLDCKEGVSFHTFSLPEDRCVGLLVKNIGKCMPESFVREELEGLDIRVREVTQLRSGRRDQNRTKDSPLTPHFIISVARGPEVSRVRSLTELCGLRVTVETYVAPKGNLQCERCQRFGHTQRNCGHVPRCVACGGSHLSSECPVPRWHLQCCSCGGGHTANYRGCFKWKEARAALAKRAPSKGPKSNTIATGKSPASKVKQVEPSGEQMEFGGVEPRLPKGRVVHSAPPHPAPNHITSQPTEARKPIVTTTSKTAKPEKPAPKTAAAPKVASVKPAVTKPVAAQPSLSKPVVTPCITSPLEGISDLLDQLPIKACEELTCRLLTSISSLPTGVAPHACYPKTRYPLCGLIWQHALGGLIVVKPCASPAEIQNSKFEPVWVNTRTATQPKYQNS
jgi:hypothetical protein